jgi:hypothetical protein
VSSTDILNYRINYGCKKFYSTGSGERKRFERLSPGLRYVDHDSIQHDGHLGQCYKTFLSIID